MAACGSSDDKDSTDDKESTQPSSAVEAAFPVTITSALGTAEIKEKPRRVATWG